MSTKDKRNNLGPIIWLFQDYKIKEDYYLERGTSEREALPERLRNGEGRSVGVCTRKLVLLNVINLESTVQ